MLKVDFGRLNLTQNPTLLVRSVRLVLPLADSTQDACDVRNDADIFWKVDAQLLRVAAAQVQLMQIPDVQNQSHGLGD